MGTICVKCGSSLAEGQAFCTSCGTRRTESAPAETTAHFCVNCGAQLAAGTSFCTKCGARAGQGAASTTTPESPTAAAPAPTVPIVPAPAAAKKPSSIAFKLFVVAACFLLVGAVALAAGVAYLGYVAKKRVTAVQKAYKNDDLAGMVGALTGQQAKTQPLPSWKPASPSLSSAPTSKIPLQPSLRFVHAGSDSLLGDFESIFIVDKVTDQVVHIKASQQFPPGQGLQRFLQGGSDNKPYKIECGRTIFVADMENSSEADGYFCRDKREDKHPGTTSMSLSKKTFNELKSTGQAEFTYHEDPLRSLLKSFKKTMAADSDASADAASQDLLKKMMNFAPNGGLSDDTMDTPPLKCTLHRQGTDLAFPVLVNDQPVELPVMDVHIKISEKEGDLYVLDDPEDPLIVAGASTEGGSEQIIKIYWDTKNDSPKNELEEELEKTGRAKIYNLYFDFRSADLRPESKKVLEEITDVMRKHPDWKLTVEGHTDNIGGDAYNLDLSKRRAAAVKDVLTYKYDVAATRLSTAGFGASRPVDTNDTIEGRARNRRVELARQ